jgi:hypothetical protein
VVCLRGGGIVVSWGGGGLLAVSGDGDGVVGRDSGFQRRYGVLESPRYARHRKDFCSLPNISGTAGLSPYSRGCVSDVIVQTAIFDNMPRLSEIRLRGTEILFQTQAASQLMLCTKIGGWTILNETAALNHTRWHSYQIQDP